MIEFMSWQVLFTWEKQKPGVFVCLFDNRQTIKEWDSFIVFIYCIRTGKQYTIKTYNTQYHTHILQTHTHIHYETINTFMPVLS